MAIKLSFCMPTYNFASFIGEAIGSIISQATDEIEIVIVDGGSTDNTREIVSMYQRDFARIRYFLRDKNMGVDKDMDKAVELAEGSFCWLISSDDKLPEGAVKKMLDEIKRGYDIYLCNRIECDLHLVPMKNRFWLEKEIQDRVFNLADKNELMEYLNQSRSIGALFSYCSSIVFNRATWNKISHDDSFIGTGYAHVYRLFSFINNGRCSLKYIKNPLVLCRGDNDSYLAAKGAIRRFLLDIDGYSFLADKLFSGSGEIKKAFLLVVRREIRLPYLIKIRSLVDTAELWSKIKGKLFYCGYSWLTVKIAEGLGIFKPVVTALRSIKKWFRMRRYRHASSLS